YGLSQTVPIRAKGVLLLLYGLSQTVPIRAKGVLLLGILIGLIPLFAYQTLAFGDPFYIPYSAYTEAGQKFTSHAQGFWGVSLPKSDVLYNILFSLKRGLFVVNPWVILLPFAALASLYVLLKRDDDYKRELSLSLTITIFFLLFNAGFGDSIVYWGGGASVGPRHILPMLPFVTLLIGLLPWQRIVEAVLVMLTPISMGIMLLATSTEPRVPYEYHSPVTELFWRNYIHGRVALGERGTFSDELMTDSSVSYNLSQMIGLPNEASLLPLFLLWTAALVLLFPFTQKAFRAFRALSLCMFFVLLVLPAAVRTRYIVRDEQSQGLLMTTIRGIAWESPNEPLRDPAIEGLEVVSRKVTPNVLLTPGMARTIPATPFSLEWQGYLRVDTPGDYYLGTESDDGSALIIDGDLLVQNWGSHATKRIMKRKYLAEGTYPITVRYYNAQAEGAMRLLWSPPFSHVHTIPPDVLRITKPKGREHT
ncbi:MAG: hypothetical protein KDD55_08295, partial [Bdellovibrionales bacterium]|nr:hypothetical protein [Bdellovibrionales bacterium]